MFVVNVEGAIYKEDKWLLIRRSEKEEHAGGCLSLVGGQVENAGVSTDILEKTLIREIDEEIGIVVTNLSYVNSSSFITDFGIPVVDIVFLCQDHVGEAYAKSVDEVDEIVWMTMEEILNDVDLPLYLKENMKLADCLKSEHLSFSKT